MPDWKDIVSQLHESISNEEGGDNSYLADSLKTPAMLRWEKRFNVRIDVGLMTYPIRCNNKRNLCAKNPQSRCFYHRYGQIDPRLVLAWKRMVGHNKMNVQTGRLYRYFRDKKTEMERMEVRRIPLILTEKEVLIVMQALALVPEDLKLEGGM